MSSTTDEEQPDNAAYHKIRHKKKQAKKQRTRLVEEHESRLRVATTSASVSKKKSSKITDDRSSWRYSAFMKQRQKRDASLAYERTHYSEHLHNSNREDAQPAADSSGRYTHIVEVTDDKRKGSERKKATGKCCVTQRAESSSDDEIAIYPMSLDGDDGSDDPSSACVDDKLNYRYNRLIYIILGYLVGIILVLIWYYWHAALADRDLNGKWMAAVLLVLLLLILCLSRGVRCVLMLMLPTLSSYKGRALLIAFAFLIAATGPVMNIIKNMQILTGSMVCHQAQLKQALLPMLDIVENPIYAVEQAMYATICKLRHIIERVDNVLTLLEHDVAHLFEGYSNCSNWLQQKQAWFDQQLDTPHRRCISAACVGVVACQSKFGPREVACNAMQLFEWFCAHLQGLKSFFDQSLELQQSLLNVVLLRMQQTVAKLREMFEASISFDHSQRQHSHRMDNSSELEAELKSQLNVHHYLFVLICLDIVIIILLFSALLRSIYFHMRYLSNDDFDNFYLMRDFYAIDEQQQRLHHPSVLPLQAAEKSKYIKLGSCHLLPVELQQMSRSVLHMFITDAQLFCICFFEYSLYQLLVLMSYYAHQMAKLEAPAYNSVTIEGGGMIGDILRGVIRAFEPVAKQYAVDTSSCVPTPVPPKYIRYYEILALCMFTWLQLLWAPYVLRLRHSIMAWFYPADAQRRACYLHRRILLQRGSFIKNARRRARTAHRYMDDNDVLNWIRRRCSWFCNNILGPIPGKSCIICSEALTSKNTVKCERSCCKAVYCSRCYAASKNKCILCHPPAAYGDFSDLSDITDSSDDPSAVPFRSELCPSMK